MHMAADFSAVMALIERLEQERSYECCCELAACLGYGISGEAGCVQLNVPDSPLLGVYFSMDVLIEDLIGDARRLMS